MSIAHPPFTTGILGEMLAKPLAFGDLVPKNTWATTAGTREVISGPRSPPRQNGHIAPTNGHVALTNGPPPDSSSQTQRASSSCLPSSPRASSKTTLQPSSSPTRPVPQPATPDRKGKTPERSLYPAEVVLSWPSPMAAVRRPAAGLYNPSMACYANATLQVLLHTPPVLRIAQAHESHTCE